MKHLLFCCLLCLIFQFATAQTITRDDAIQIALNEHIVPANLKHTVTAYITESPLSRGDVLLPFIDGTEKAISSASWFIWINDNADAFFAHPTRYLLIDARTGAQDLYYENWWPELNGESIFMTESQRNDLNLIFYSDLHRTESDN